MFNCQHFALAAVSAFITISAVSTASAQNWPARPVTMVVPYAAGSSSDIAGRIREFLSASGRANAMAEFAREKGKERFHPKMVAARHLEIYREMLNGSRSAAS